MRHNCHSQEKDNYVDKLRIKKGLRQEIHSKISQLTRLTGSIVRRDSSNSGSKFEAVQYQKVKKIQEGKI